MRSNGLWRWTHGAAPKATWDPSAADLSMSPPLDSPPHAPRHSVIAARHRERGWADVLCWLSAGPDLPA
jgi:hypothetical protein